MSATQLQTATRGGAALDGIHVSFAGLVRSEWIKLRTLRSTVWCYLLIVAVTIGLGVLAAASIPTSIPGTRLEVARQITIMTSTFAVNLTQLIAVVLGVLVISGEYRTGMIRSTLTAAPGRLGAYFAKALVLAVATFVVSAVAIALTAAVTAPILAAKDLTFVLGRADVLLPLLGGAAYLALMALLALAIGTIVRNSAGGIATAVALILVVPILLGILTSLLRGAAWVQNVAAVLPAAAGAHRFAYVPASLPAQTAQPGVLELGAAGGRAVLLGWIVGLGFLGAGLLTRRDA